MPQPDPLGARRQCGDGCRAQLLQLFFNCDAGKNEGKVRNFSNETDVFGIPGGAGGVVDLHADPVGLALVLDEVVGALSHEVELQAVEGGVVRVAHGRAAAEAGLVGAVPLAAAADAADEDKEYKFL